MNTNYLVNDNWYPDFESERHTAFQATYIEKEVDGVKYHNISEIEDVSDQSRIETLIKAESKFSRFNSFYRKYDPSLPNNTYIHTDASMGDINAVIFLNEKKECYGGIAFWRHRFTGLLKAPNAEEAKLAHMSDSWMTAINNDGLDESLWEMIDYVPMESNRCVIFNSSRFHSRWPKVSNEPARLIKAHFGAL